MPKRRDLKLDEYNISKYQYRELHNFCLQYPEKRQKAASLLGTSSQNLTGMPNGSGKSDETAKLVELRDKLLKDCEMIEQSAIEANSAWYQQIILGVTEDVPWRYLRLVRDMELPEKDYRAARRKFYYILAIKKGLIF